MVADDGGMTQLLDAQEVLLQLQDVLLVHTDYLHRIDLTRLAIFAPVDACIGALPNHLQQSVLVVEAVDVAAVLLFILVRILPQQPFGEHSVC